MSARGDSAGDSETRRAEERDAAEAALLARVAGGDRNTPMLELYDRYSAPVYRLGLRLLGDASRAEELVQETFVRLWQSAGRFDSRESSVRGWVFLLARRTAVDAQRRAGARPPSAPAAAQAAAESRADPVAEGEADRALLGIEVRDAMEVLSDKHREVIELSYAEDLTQTQIAARLEVPLGTVKTRTYHALRALRGEFDRRGLRA